MKKLITKNNLYWETLYINISKDQLKRLEFNHCWFTVLKINKAGVFTFPAKYKDLLDNI